MGLAEMNFLSGLSPEKRYEALDRCSVSNRRLSS